MIPPKPQSYETLRQRYPEALKRVYDLDKGIPSPRPGEQSQHVFDHTGGVRLIISRDKYNGQIMLHVSASWWMNQFDADVALVTVFGQICVAITEITGQLNPAKYFLTITRDKGIPHFEFPDPGLS